MPRLGLRVRGIVQGVGFRPFVYQLAQRYGLAGWVCNDPQGVLIEAQGGPEALEAFIEALEREQPPAAHVASITRTELAEGREVSFSILESGLSGGPSPSIPPDLAMCEACEAEITDPSDRRYRYPFTNCTHCGPRYSLIAGMPYDRARTGMAGFRLCPDCRRDYEDPLNRRFHAEPVACPACGPRARLLELGASTGSGDEALRRAARVLEAGSVLALQGLGGFQLLVDATSEAAVARLRARKHREDKPFAVMFRSLGEVRAHAEVCAEEAALLTSSQAPILLLARRHSELAPSVAPGNPRVGAMLPTTPLHRLLVDLFPRPLVCTSGNLSEEPMAITESEALRDLGEVADAFLVHDRPILRPIDDSVLRLDPDGPLVFRRARGYAPLPHPLAGLPADLPPMLALGAHQKSTVAILQGGQALVSQHLGDLHTLRGVRLLERTVDDLLDFLKVQPAGLVCDAHPDYASTRLAERLAAKGNLPLLRVQHHHAHVAAVMAEHGLEGSVLGLAWDGSGWGPDGTVWGGEALWVEGAKARRLGHLRTYGLPGGDRAVRDPRRSAAGLLWEARGELSSLGFPLADSERSLLERSLERGFQTPRTSSMGRLFDAVSALLGLSLEPGFEGQAAMRLEFAAEAAESGGEAGAYGFDLREGVADFLPLMNSLLEDRVRRVPVEVMAHRFHGALADLALQWARQAGEARVILSGGCFQNRLLLRLCRRRLEGEGFQVYRPTAFPPNDGGISLGQLWVGAHSRLRIS